VRRTQGGFQAQLFDKERGTGTLFGGSWTSGDLSWAVGRTQGRFQA
jgi:hypothetical protein